MLQARVPGQAGSVAETPRCRWHRQPNNPPMTMTPMTKERLHTHLTSRQLQQGHQQNLRGFHTSRDFTHGEVSPCPPPSPALLSLYTLCIQYLGINSAFVISVLGRDAVVRFGEERRKMAHASFWTGDASEMLIDSPLSLSTMWITGFFTLIYLSFFCYCDFFKFFFFFKPLPKLGSSGQYSYE